MHAGLALGEDSLRASGSSLLVVSRPGYGRTRVGAIGAREFAVVAGQLCDRLGIPTLEAVVAISAGGRTAVEMAAHDPRRVRRLILQSAAPALGPWPESRAQRLVPPPLRAPDRTDHLGRHAAPAHPAAPPRHARRGQAPDQPVA